MKKFMEVNVPVVCNLANYRELQLRMCRMRSCPDRGRASLCEKCLFAEGNMPQFRQWLKVRDAAPKLLEALKPFVFLECDDWQTCNCHICKGKQAVTEAETE